MCGYAQDGYKHPVPCLSANGRTTLYIKRFRQAINSTGVTEGKQDSGGWVARLLGERNGTLAKLSKEGHDSHSSALVNKMKSTGS
jgi:hypothetical protein